MTEEQRSQAGKGLPPAGSFHHASGEAASPPAEITIRFFIAGFFNSLVGAEVLVVVLLAQHLAQAALAQHVALVPRLLDGRLRLLVGVVVPVLRPPGAGVLVPDHVA